MITAGSERARVPPRMNPERLGKFSPCVAMSHVGGRRGPRIGWARRAPALPPPGPGRASASDERSLALLWPENTAGGPCRAARGRREGLALAGPTPRREHRMTVTVRGLFPTRKGGPHEQHHLADRCDRRDPRDPFFPRTEIRPRSFAPARGRTKIASSGRSLPPRGTGLNSPLAERHTTDRAWGARAPAKSSRRSFRPGTAAAATSRRGLRRQSPAR